MTSFEKSVAVLISGVAFVILIIVLVLSSVTAVQVHSLQQNQQHYNLPKVTRDRHGNLEIEIPEEFEEPSIPSYKRPGNLGEKK